MGRVREAVLSLTRVELGEGKAPGILRVEQRRGPSGQSRESGERQVGEMWNGPGMWGQGSFKRLPKAGLRSWGCIWCTV